MLAIPSYGLNYSVNNYNSGTPKATAYGTSITLGNSNADGTVVDLLGAALAADCYWVDVGLCTATGSSGVDTSALVDIMYDPAGGTAWSVLVPDLLAGFMQQGTSGLGGIMTYRFPLYAPKGATIGARGQTIRSSGTNTCTVCIRLLGGPSKPGFWFGTRVTAVGVDAANSAGLDHTGGNSGALSSFTSIGGTGNPAFSYLEMGIQGASATHAALQYHFEGGFGGVQCPGLMIHGGITATELLTSGWLAMGKGTWVSVPAATQLQVRGTCSGTAEPMNLMLYGVS